MIVRFFYHHLNLIYYSLIGLTQIGNMILLIKKSSFGNDILKHINFKVRDLDRQAMGGGLAGTVKNIRLITINRPYINAIHPRLGNNEVLK